MPNILEDEDRFATSEFAPAPDEEDTASPGETVEEVVSSLRDSSCDALDLEVEKRFEIAMHYRMLLKDSLFSPPETEASRFVESEARAFFRDRLETLLGIKTMPKSEDKGLPPVVLPFDEDEIAALRAVAKRLISKPELAEVKTPTLNKAPAVSSPTPRVAPQKRSGPASKPAPQLRSTTSTKPLPDNGVVADTGQIVREGAKTYRVVKNDKGTDFKMDITKLLPTNRTPTPNRDQMEAISLSQASQQVSQLGPVIQNVAAHAVSQGEGEKNG